MTVVGMCKCALIFSFILILTLTVIIPQNGCVQAKQTDNFNLTSVPFPYPVAASWFKDRYYEEEWEQTLDRFGKQGGHIVWQRGRPLRKIDPIDIYRDPDYAWCFINGKSCVEEIDERVKSQNGTIMNHLIYDYNEGYSSIVMSCPEIEIYINSSRIYYVLVLPHKQGQQACSITNQQVDILFTSFDGLDSKTLLVDIASQKNMSVYLGMPGIPPSDGALDGSVDLTLVPAFIDWCRRVFLDYAYRHGNYSSFVGVYQSLEVSLAANSEKNLYPVYGDIKQCLNTNLPGKLLALSPYVDVNLSQINNTVEDHRQNFLELARISRADVIAIQEGRGVAKAAYFWPQQVNMEIAQVDPMLLRIVQYLDPTVPSNVTYQQQYTGSTHMLFSAFRSAQQQLKEDEDIIFELWANLEAFEYLRDLPCLPVDDLGNGMAERLDRTDKQRIDWGLTCQGALVNQIISFAWDACYLCYRNTGYSTSLSDQIVVDYQRPIVSRAFFEGEQNGEVPKNISILGFHISSDVVFDLLWTQSDGSSAKHSFSPVFVNSNFGNEANYSPLLQLAVINVENVISSLLPNGFIDITAVNTRTKQYAFHFWSLNY